MIRLGGFVGRNEGPVRAALGVALIACCLGCSQGQATAGNTAGAPVVSAPVPPPTAAVKDDTSPSASTTAALDGSDPEALFQLILAEQEKSMRKLRKLKFTSHWERNWVTPGQEKKLVHDYTVIRDGDWGWCKKHVYPPAAPGQEAAAVQVTYRVWNDQYVFSWMPGMAIAYMWEYDSPDTMSEAARVEIKFAGAFPEPVHGFGTGLRPLSEVGRRDPKTSPSCFEAARSADTEGRVFYTLSGRMADRNSYPRPSWVLTVDPAKGYLVTRGVAQHPGSTVGKMREFTVIPKEIASGVWFPVGWDITEYRSVDPSTGKQPASIISKYTVTDVQFDPEVDPDQFTWKSIDLPPGTIVMRHDKSGEIDYLRIVNGELVVKELAEGQS